jgi:hypothetical protein
MHAKSATRTVKRQTTLHRISETSYRQMSNISNIERSYKSIWNRSSTHWEKWVKDMHRQFRGKENSKLETFIKGKVI